MFAALLTPREAAAQEWLKDRRYQEGAGLRLGDIELHPGIGGEIGYDSNWFLRSHKEDPRFVNGAPNNPVRSGGMLRLTPSLRISTLGVQRSAAGEGPATPASIGFRAGVSATYREFIGNDELTRQRNAGLAADATLSILQDRPVGFNVFGAYQRLIQPSVVADPNVSFNRNDISGGGELVVLPGGGTLDMRLAYQLRASLFEETNGVPFTNITHEVAARNRWKFRPRTALFHDTTLRFINYPQAQRSQLFLNDSTPLRTRIGVNGLVTDRFGTLLAVGYGGSFFKDPASAAAQQYDSINAQAEGTLYLSQPQPGGKDAEPGQATLLLSTVSLGFARDFQNSFLGNFYTSNKGYARLVYFFGGRTLVQLDGYGEGLSYPGVFYNSPTGPQQVKGDFTNFRVGGTLFGEYRFTDAFGVNATFDYTEMISDTEIPTAINAPGGQAFHLAYRRFQAFLGARLFL